MHFYLLYRNHFILSVLVCSRRRLGYKALPVQIAWKGKAMKTLMFRRKVYFTEKGAQSTVGIICTHWKNKFMVNEIVSLPNTWSFLIHNGISAVRFHWSNWLYGPLFKQLCQSWKNSSSTWQQNAINTEGCPLNQKRMQEIPNNFSNKLPAGRTKMNFITEDKWTVQYL